MAEGLAIAASVIAVIQITDRVIDFCKLYVEHVRDLPADIKTILLELSTLKTVLENLKFLIKYDSITSPVLSSLGGTAGAIEGCRGLVDELEKLLTADTIQKKKNGKAKITLAALKWPLKQTKAQKLLARIVDFKSTITLAITAEASLDIKETKQTTKEIYAALTEHQRHEVCRWLVLTDPSPLHHKAQKDFEPGTGDWMLRVPEWKSWLSGDVRFLWIHGIPGAGKTVLLSHLIERTTEHGTALQTNEQVCLYYYCYFARGQDETAPFLRWILNKLCRQLKRLPQSIYKLYKDGSEPTIMDLMDALANLASKFASIYVLLDALDESNPRQDLLSVLEMIYSQDRFKNIQLLATSREYSDIKNSMSKIATSISMSNPAVDEDIRRYVRSTLQSNPNLKQRWSQDLIDEIESALCTKANGMFRWVVCQIDLLKRLKSDRKTIHQALSSLPRTLYDTYDRILNFIPEDDRLVVHHTLQWIRYHSYINRDVALPKKILPQAVEKSVAIATKGENNRLCDMVSLEEICGCLIRVTPTLIKGTGRYRHSYLSVSFAHHTVLEYCNLAQTSIPPVFCPSVFKTNIDFFLVETILRAAYNVMDPDLWKDTDISLSKDPLEIALENIAVYSAAPALHLIRHFPMNLSENQKLIQLMIDLLKPLINRDSVVKSTLRRLTHSSSYSFAVFLPTKFLEVYIIHSHSSQSLLLNMLLLIDANPLNGPLARLLQVEDASILFGSHISVKVPEYGLRMVRKSGSRYKLLSGPMIEILARLAHWTYEESFNLVLKYSSGWFDPSTVLLFYTASHKHSVCIGIRCPISTLLEMGADPNLSTRMLTPLQIAAARGDFEAARQLLAGGASTSVDQVGQNLVSQEDDLLQQFEQFHNKTPMSILQSLWESRHTHRDGAPDNDLIAIRSLLIQYGARAESEFVN